MIRLSPGNDFTGRVAVPARVRGVERRSPPRNGSGATFAAAQSRLAHGFEGPGPQQPQIWLLRAVNMPRHAASAPAEIRKQGL